MTVSKRARRGLLTSGLVDSHAGEVKNIHRAERAAHIVWPLGGEVERTQAHHYPSPRFDIDASGVGARPAFCS